MVNIKTSLTNGHLTIFIDRKFTYYDKAAFIKICENNITDIKKITIDLISSDYIDSSALGLLIVAKEELARQTKNIDFHVNVQTDPSIKPIMELSNFKNLFQIHYIDKKK